MAYLSTQVSKAHPAIKKIASLLHDWRGRTVVINQVDPTSSWAYSLYNDSGEPHVYRVVLGKYTTARRIPKPAYDAPATRIEAPSGGEALLMREIGHTGTITIVIPVLDPAQLDVARDARLSGDKKLAAKVLEALGPYAGVADAILEAQTKTLAQATSEDKPTSKASKRRLDRDIDAFMKTRGG